MVNREMSLATLMPTIDPMKWLCAIIRIVGVSFPGMSSLVQLQAELDANSIDDRLKKLEDPISALHEDVPELSKLIYSRIQIAESNSISLDDSSYAKFRRALASLESAGHIRGAHALGKRFAAGLRVENATYMLYMCSLFEDESKMDKLIEIVESCHRGQSLRAQNVMQETGLANAVINAVFKIFEAKGYGIRSKEVGLNQAYMGTT